MKALVLGSGLIGSILASDLAKDFEVTVMDPSERALSSLKVPGNVRKLQAEATDPEVLEKAALDADITFVALPSRIEGEVMRQLILMKKPFVSPSGYYHIDGLDELAKQEGVTTLFDMGIAPGMSNYLLGVGAHRLDELDEGRIYVTGIPDKLDPPFNYRTVFCLSDTLGEYVLPVYYVKDGKPAVAEALSGIEMVDIPGVGTLEAFFTDGLRSAAVNIKGKLLFEKTMRWPGYAETIKVLRTMGLLDENPIDVNGTSVVPRDVAIALLEPLWRFRPERGDRDLTIMRVITSGRQGRDRVTYQWDLIDRYDEKTGNHSMGRTTAFPCAIAGRAIARGMITQKGFLAPEQLAGDESFHRYLMSELKARGVVFKESILRELADID